MVFARIEIEFIGAVSLNDIINFEFDGNNIAEQAKSIRTFPGTLGTYDIGSNSPSTFPLNQLAFNYVSALEFDYSDGIGAINPYKFSAYNDGVNLNKVIVQANELGHTFTAGISNPGVTKKVFPESASFSILNVTPSSSQVLEKCANSRYNISFGNETYPIQLTAPIVKTINNAAEAWYEAPRQPSVVISATDNAGAGDTDTYDQPTVSTYLIQYPDIQEGLNFSVVNLQYSETSGDVNASYQFKIDAGGTYQSSPQFPNIPAGNYTAYILDSFGCEQTIAFEVLGGVTMPPAINFVGKDQRTKVGFKIENPIETTNLRFNLYINFPRLAKTQSLAIKKTLNPIETSHGIYEATFDINNVLWGEIQNYLDNIEDYPVYNRPFFSFPVTDIIVNHDELLMDYYIDTSYSYTDNDGNVVEADKTDNLGVTQFYRNAMVGGVSRLFNAYLSDANSSLIDYLNPNVDDIRWLSWMPNKKSSSAQVIDFSVHPNQPQRMWIINNNALEGVNLKMQIFWEQGAISQVQDVYRRAQNTGLFEVICGPSELGVFNVDPSRMVLYYEFWVENDAGTRRSEKRRFAIDYKYYERNDIFFFKTSLGVYEVLWANGRKQEKRDLEHIESDRPLAEPQLNKGTIVAERSQFVIPSSHNTGFKPKSNRQWLTDFLISNDIQLPAEFYMVPLIQTRKSFDFGADDQDMFALPFSMKVAHLESHYSGLPEQITSFGDFNNDFNNDYFI